MDDFNRLIDNNALPGAAYYNRGVLHETQGNFSIAIDDYSKAIEINPRNVRALNNRGVVYREMKKLDSALDDFDRAIELNPNFYEPYWNKSLTLLLKGDYVNGWRFYEYRWKCKNFTSPQRHQDRPLWMGEQRLSGKTILVHSEQGLGDSLQFCRYISLLKSMECKIVLEIEEPLMRIMSSILPAENIYKKVVTCTF